MLIDDPEHRGNAIYTDARTHYDKLIDEGNDPVHDSELLKKYMGNWDGQQFIDDMQLTGNEAVEEAEMIAYGNIEKILSA